MENNILSLEEALVIADLFDRFGDSKSADAIDDYISKFASTNDTIKQAGLFKNLMRKLVGFGKSVFFKVYRELYAEAKKAMEQLDEKVADINDEYKQIRQDFKYHDLEGWRGRVHQLGLQDSKKIMNGFDRAYGKLVQYLGIKGDKETDTSSPDSALEKLPDLGQEPAQETEQEQDKGLWSRQTPGAQEGWNEVAKNIAYNPSLGAMRFDKKYFNYLLGKHLAVDGTENVRYWSAYADSQQPLDGRLKEMMGEDEWQYREQDDFVYLFPKKRGSDVGAPAVEVVPEESLPDPELPMPPKEQKEEFLAQQHEEETELTEEIKQEEPPEVKQEEPSEDVKQEEPKKDEDTFEISEIEEMTAPKEPETNRVWVRLQSPIRRGKNVYYVFSLLKSTSAKKYERQNKGTIVGDQSLTQFLDTARTKNFAGHTAGGKRIFLPADAQLREHYMNELKEQWEK